MKRNLFIFFILFTFSSQLTVNAAGGDTITAIENSIFGYDYKNESDTVRIERLESYLYGTKKSGNIQTRLKNIQNDTGFTLPEIPEKKQPTLPNNHSNNSMPSPDNSLSNLKEDDSVDYPIVDEMEKEVFKTTYKNENIYNRLDRLEQKVFNSKSNASLSERVNNLASVMSPSKNRRTQSNPYASYSADDLNSYYSNSGLENINDQSMPFQLAVLEQELLRNNYNNDNISNRLSRLEQKLFKRTFQSDADINRLQRIMVAYDAKKNSYKYENNRRMQNMATVSQIGGILLMILAILL